MPFEVKVAFRYLRSSKLQTGLILAGIAVGIVAYTFMAALINGLEVNLTDDVIGNVAHIVLEPPEALPRLIAALPPEEALVAVQRANERRPEIEGWRPMVASIEAQDGITAVAPMVMGNGFFQRGEKVMPVGINGVVPARVSAILDLEGRLVQGSAQVGPSDVLIGVALADELGVTVGQRLRLRSDRDRERTLNVRGIFDVGSASVNERLAFVDLRTGQSLLDLGGAISRIELEVADIYQAPSIATQLAASTGLEATDWIAANQRLQQALRAQGSTGSLIKVFSLLTIVIGVASVLLLAAVRRRGEIGIMRSFGISRGSVQWIFQIQGFLLGLIGSGIGAAGGYGFCLLLQAVTRRPDGTYGLPVDPALGEYGTAMALATVASTLAAILPARAAAKVDPVEALQP